MLHEKSYKVLIVEDEKIVVEDIKHSLSRLGYIITDAVSDGQAALDSVMKQRPDVVLMDIQLRGEMNGIQTAEQIYQKFQIPVIYLTAYADQTTFKDARQTEPFGFFTKPFDEGSIHRAIELAMDQHQKINQVESNVKALDTAVRTINVGIVLLDFQHHVRYLNSQAEEMTGWTWQQAMEKSCDEVIRLFHHDTGQPMDLPKKLLHKGETQQITEPITLKTRDGVTKPIYFYREPNFDNANQFTGETWILQDVTQSEGNKDRVFRELEKIINTLYESSAPNRNHAQPGVKLGGTLIKIAELLPHILYIRAESPYCHVALKASEDPPYKFRISFHALEANFESTALLKVHRSFMINPRCAVVVNRDGGRDYRLMLRDSDNQTMYVPLSRSEIGVFRNTHPHWFH